MYHSITFGGKNTWSDWGLIPTSRPVFSPPSVKTVYVDIPGADGSIDLSDVLTGDVKYENRSGSFEFRVDRSRNWSIVYSEILNFLHGQKLKIFLDDDPGYYYYGRAQVNQWKSDKNFSLITIDAFVEPYKYEKYSSLEDWVWDTFNFETGIIREYKNIRVDGELRLDIIPTRKMIVPTITVMLDEGATMRVRYGWGSTYNLSEGDNKILAIKIWTGNQYNFLRFYGDGYVSVNYRGASL